MSVSQLCRGAQVRSVIIFTVCRGRYSTCLLGCLLFRCPAIMFLPSWILYLALSPHLSTVVPQPAPTKTPEATPAPRRWVEGLDVSGADWPVINLADQARAGAQFAYIRCTYGAGRSSPRIPCRPTTDTFWSDGLEPHFNDHWQVAERAGLLIGAYHVADPRASSGGSQALFFWRNGGHRCRWSAHLSLVKCAEARLRGRSGDPDAAGRSFHRDGAGSSVRLQ